jgi:hypothetical protein
VADLPSLIARARLEIGDVAHPFRAESQGDGVTSVINTPSKPILAASIVVTRAGTTTSILNQGTDYTVDESNGVITLATPVAVGTVLTVSGTAYRYFTDADWTTFASTAIVDHLHNRQDVQDITQLPVHEEYPVALLIVVQALFALVNDAAFDINISTPEGVGIPRAQRFEQLQQMLATRLDQYNKWCSAFNVGLWRIEMFDLRRVSKQTNRLIPIYTPQEFVDSRPPTEQFPAIDANGPRIVPVLPLGQTINLVAYSNQSFSYTVTLNQDITGKIVKASIRRYPQTFTPLYVFKVDVTNYTTGVVTISLTGPQTYYVGTSKFWDLELIDSQGNYTTVAGGTFDAIRQGSA